MLKLKEENIAAVFNREISNNVYGTPELNMCILCLTEKWRSITFLDHIFLRRNLNLLINVDASIDFCRKMLREKWCKWYLYDLYNFLPWCFCIFCFSYITIVYCAWMFKNHETLGCIIVVCSMCACDP